jgi:hypothetical protein
MNYKEIIPLSALLTLSMLNGKVDPLSAQNARISASASFINAGTTTITTNTAGSNITTTGVDGAGNPFTTNTSIGPITTTTVSNGVITTVSVESSLPRGLFYAGPVVALPAYTTTAAGDMVVGSLELGSGGVTPVIPSASFTNAAASILLQAASGNPSSLTPSQLEAAAALIKAGAGISGLE